MLFSSRNNFIHKKILPAVVVLIIPLLAVPVFSYYFGTPPGPVEWTIIHTLVAILVGSGRPLTLDSLTRDYGLIAAILIASLNKPSGSRFSRGNLVNSSQYFRDR